jgi:iron complex outermembrane receptor protein
VYEIETHCSPEESDGMFMISGRNALLRLMALILACEIVQGQASPQDLTQLKLEDLMNMEVTSVSKKEQKISEAASAVFVITSEDIARSGANNIPDLLRMVPGVEVAQINSSKWAISIRGFNGQYSNKLLVLVDGRTVYTPMLSGVFWDALDVTLDNIDRIEVIRGPGATVWGANAVNGVINIITKKASDTQGGFATAGGGSYEHGFGAARYGGRFGGATAYRVFADGFDRNHFPTPFGLNGNDEWEMVHGGFRVDTSASAQDSITVEGDANSGNAGEVASSVVSISPPINGLFDLRDRYSGWDLLSRWNHIASAHSETSLQVYFDRNTRSDTTYGFGVNTFDLDFQHHISWGTRQDFVWGLGYRLSSDDTLATLRISFTPASRTTQLFSSFVQDEITILPDRLYLSVGTKLEHNDYTGFGLEPSARIAWTPSARNTLWAAVSQAQRIPSRGDAGILVSLEALPGPNNIPMLVGYTGNPDQKAERETSVETGYRARLSSHVSLDSTMFFNHYGDLVSVEQGSPLFDADPTPHLVVLSRFGNLLYGETHGFETLVDWKVTRRWTLSPSYSFLTMHLHREAASNDLTSAPNTEGSVPNHQAQLRSQMNLPRHLQWNTSAYFVGALPALAVPSYTHLDSNITWQAGERFSISLVGQNLLRDRHLEYAGPDSSVQSDLIKRSAYAKFAWSF